LSLASIWSMSASSTAAIRRRIFPAASRGRTVVSSALYWSADFFTGAPPGTQFPEQPVYPVQRLRPGPGQLVAAGRTTTAAPSAPDHC
jgi:hypothetical protein